MQIVVCFQTKIVKDFFRKQTSSYYGQSGVTKCLFVFVSYRLILFLKIKEKCMIFIMIGDVKPIKDKHFNRWT